MYCDFYSVPPDSHQVHRIINELKAELDYFFHHLPGLTLKTIYIGGGTPSSIPVSLFTSLLAAITSFPMENVSEFTVEANPESITEEFILLCKEFYVTRLSCGIQTTHNRFLGILGRGANFAHIEKAKELVTTYWQGDLNVDLITGIPGTIDPATHNHTPGQTKKMIEEDISYCVDKFKPDHISLYSLTIEPDTELSRLIRDNKLRQLSMEKADSLWFHGYQLLESKKIMNYEISNFAYPGKESIHNLQYWHLNPYIGIGPGAVSTLPGKNRSVIRLFHERNMGTFLAGKEKAWGIECEYINIKEFLFETCMMGFRLKQGINKQAFIHRFGKSLPDIVPHLWDTWLGAGWVVDNPLTYALTDHGRFLLNTLLIELSEHLDKSSLYLSLVQWP